jgi:hypothetical protein
VQRRIFSTVGNGESSEGAEKLAALVEHVYGLNQWPGANENWIWARTTHPGAPSGRTTVLYAPSWTLIARSPKTNTRPTSRPTGTVHALPESAIQSQVELKEPAALEVVTSQDLDRGLIHGGSISIPSEGPEMAHQHAVQPRPARVQERPGRPGRPLTGSKPGGRRAAALPIVLGTIEAILVRADQGWSGSTFRGVVR